MMPSLNNNYCKFVSTESVRRMIKKGVLKNRRCFIDIGPISVLVELHLAWFRLMKHWFRILIYHNHIVVGYTRNGLDIPHKRWVAIDVKVERITESSDRFSDLCQLKVVHGVEQFAAD